MWREPLQFAYRTARKIVIAIVGATIVLVGVVLIFTPGPAFLVIPAGLAVLGVEFAWARRWLKKLRERAAIMQRKKNPSGQPPLPPSADI